MYYGLLGWFNMSESDSLVNKRAWLKEKESIDKKPKFLPKGAMVTLFATPEPEKTTIDGKFGEQTMYLIHGKTSDGRKCIFQANESQMSDIAGKMNEANFPKDGLPYMRSR